MQVRKLIRLLEQLVEKNPRAKYMEACIDIRYAKCQCDDLTFAPIADIEIHNCVWDSENTENECQRDVVVFGNY